MDIKVGRAPDGTFLSAQFLRPSNFHAHFRLSAMMRAIAPHIMRHVKYVLAMPNNGPIVGIAEAQMYFAELMRIAAQNGFDHLSGILMTLYHTADTTSEVIEQIARSKIVRAVKHYPPHPGATTGSGHGIPLDDPRSDRMLRAMEDCGVPLLGHFESPVDADGNDLPHLRRERYMVDNVLWSFRDKYPRLRICFEHASTKAAIEFVKADTSGRTVLTATPQHLTFTDEDLMKFSWRNHLKCMPIVKPKEDRDAVIEFVTSGDPRVIMGDDTAAHPSRTKNKPFDECASGCYLPHAIAFYTRVFEQAGALDERFVNFVSRNGPRWWNLPQPDDNDTVIVRREMSNDIPDPVEVDLPDGRDIVIPLGWTEEADRLQLGYAAV